VCSEIGVVVLLHSRLLAYKDYRTQLLVFVNCGSTGLHIALFLASLLCILVHIDIHRCECRNAFADGVMDGELVIVHVPKCSNVQQVSSLTRTTFIRNVYFSTGVPTDL